MNIIEIKRNKFHIPQWKNKIKIINQVLEKYQIDPQQSLRKYNAPIISVEMIASKDKIDHIRNDILKTILEHCMNVNKNYGKLSKCLTSDSYLPFFFDKTYDYCAITTFFRPYANIVSKSECFYFITDKNDMLVYNAPKNEPITFIDCVQRNDNIEDAITEYNYYSDYNKIIMFCEW